MAVDVVRRCQPLLWYHVANLLGWDYRSKDGNMHGRTYATSYLVDRTDPFALALPRAAGEITPDMLNRVALKERDLNRPQPVVSHMPQ